MHIRIKICPDVINNDSLLQSERYDIKIKAETNQYESKGHTHKRPIRYSKISRKWDMKSITGIDFPAMITLRSLANVGQLVLIVSFYGNPDIEQI